MNKMADEAWHEWPVELVGSWLEANGLASVKEKFKGKPTTKLDQQNMFVKSQLICPG